MICKRKLTLIVFISTLLAVMCISPVIIKNINNIYYLNSGECFFIDLNYDIVNANLAKVFDRAIKISQLGENKGYSTYNSVTQKDSRSSINILIESNDNFNLTDIDNENFQKYLLNINKNKYFDIVFSEENLYIVYIEKERNKSFNFAVKPIYYRALSTNNLTELFTFRKKPEEILPEEIIKLQDSINKQVLMSGIYFYRFNEPTINFKYSLSQEKITPYLSKRKLNVEKIDVELNVRATNYWARTYLSSPAYNKDYSDYIDNLALSTSDNISEIISNKYIYDISILEKTINYTKLKGEDQIKIKSTLLVNEEIENFDFITEIVTQNLNKAPSYTIYLKCSIK